MSWASVWQQPASFCGAAFIHRPRTLCRPWRTAMPSAPWSWSAMLASASGPSCKPHPRPKAPTRSTAGRPASSPVSPTACCSRSAARPTTPSSAGRAAPIPSLSPSPLGILIHPEFGLWHALRAALLFRDRRELPVFEARPSPCDTCAAKPCLHTCPVGAFTPTGYNVVTCRAYLHTLSGQPCMTQGCQARLACPVGRNNAYRGGLAQHLMRAFARG